MQETTPIINTVDTLKQSNDKLSETKDDQKTNPTVNESIQPRSDKDFRDIAISLIKENPKNARLRFNQEEIFNLANAIKNIGFRGILEVIKTPDIEEYILVYGHKRLMAAKEAGLNKIPCIIVDETELITRKASFNENFLRSSITKIEQAFELQAFKNDFKDITNVQLIEMTGLTETKISRFLNLLRLPKYVQDLILDGEFAYGLAYCLIPYIDFLTEEKIIETVNMAIEKDWLAEDLRNHLDPPEKSEQLETFEKRFIDNEKLTGQKIGKRDKKGWLKVTFKCHEDNLDLIFPE